MGLYGGDDTEKEYMENIKKKFPECRVFSRFIPTNLYSVTEVDVFHSINLRRKTEL